MPRVVSLVPSVTETLLAWGIAPIACTRFCEQPNLPHVGGTKNPDVDGIVALSPDLVIMDTEENRREDHQALQVAGIAVHALSVRSLVEVGPALTGLAALLGVTWRPPSLPSPLPRRWSAFVPIWRRPYMALGSPTYGTSLLEHLGVANVYAGADAYPEVTLEEAAARRPAVVLAPSEPYPFGARQLPELSTVGPVVFVDGKDLFWWGTRTSGALDRLREALGDLP